MEREAEDELCANRIMSMSMFAMVYAIGIVGGGVWLSTYHDSSQKLLPPVIIGFGAVLFLISFIGFVAAMKYNVSLLWTYLIMLGFICVVLLVFTVSWLIVTNHGPGRHVADLRYKEYGLQDCSSWLKKMLNHKHIWRYIKSYLLPNDCSLLSQYYETPEIFKLAKLDSIDSGCCRPPSECGYTTVNASYYDLSVEPISSNKDCTLYKNSKAIKCFDCGSCAAGFAVNQRLQLGWFLTAMVLAFISLIMMIYCGGRLIQLAETSRLRRGSIYPDEMLQGSV